MKGYRRGDIVKYTGVMLWELYDKVGIYLEQSVDEKGRFYPVGPRGGVFTILFGDKKYRLYADDIIHFKGQEHV